MNASHTTKHAVSGSPTETYMPIPDEVREAIHQYVLYHDKARWTALERAIERALELAEVKGRVAEGERMLAQVRAQAAALSGEKP